MTDNRFMVDDCGTVIDMKTRDTYDYVSDVVTLLNELHEENEQLKQAIAETEKMVQSTYDELTKLRCIKKNLRRIQSQWDWIMEAIQYD